MTSSMPVPPIHFAEARDARLAYQIWGEGDQTIVAIPPLAQNIELAWERPEIRAMLDRFGSFCRYLHFDKRGTPPTSAAEYPGSTNALKTCGRSWTTPVSTAPTCSCSPTGGRWPKSS